jgi:glucose/arabinose dehydrogenase
VRGRGAAAGLALALELLAVAVVAAGCAGAEKRSETPFLPLSPEPVALVRVAGGFEAPVQAVVAPGRPGRLHVVEQTGRIRVLDTEMGAVEPSPLLDLSDLVTAGGEQGLLALAFHPGFPSDPRLYVHYSDLEGDTRVVEYRAAGAAVEPVRELLHVEQPYENHNGGQLAFGPDGLLYLGLGDGGAAFDPEGRSQDLSTLLGKLLRLDVDRPEADPRDLVDRGAEVPHHVGDGDVHDGRVDELQHRRQCHCDGDEVLVLVPVVGVRDGGDRDRRHYRVRTCASTDMPGRRGRPSPQPRVT